MTVRTPRCVRLQRLFLQWKWLTTKQAKAFEDGVPTAHVVRLPGADHYVYLSNEADVLREMKPFLSNLR